MHQAVENRVSKCQVADVLVPEFDGHLACNDRRGKVDSQYFVGSRSYGGHSVKHHSSSLGFACWPPTSARSRNHMPPILGILVD